MRSQLKTDFHKYNGGRNFHTHFLLGTETIIEQETGFVDDKGEKRKKQVKVLHPARWFWRNHQRYVADAYGPTAMAFLKENGRLPSKAERLEYAQSKKQ